MCLYQHKIIILLDFYCLISFIAVSSIDTEYKFVKQSVSTDFL